MDTQECNAKQIGTNAGQIPVRTEASVTMGLLCLIVPAHLDSLVKINNKQ